MSNIPAELRYSEDHEWISTSAPWKIGVSDYAQNALGDLTYVELPSVGDTFEKGQEFGTLHQVREPSVHARRRHHQGRQRSAGGCP